MNKWCKAILSGVFLIYAAGCMSDDPDFFLFSYEYDFAEGQHGWEGDFTDYPVADSLNYDLAAVYTDLPANLGENKKSMMFSGNNHSDDLFMFMKKKITSLQPNTDYTIAFDVEFASNAPKSSVGAGGSPGESVYLKAGASGVEPKKVIDGDNYVLNIDKGNQATGGRDMVVIGNISNTGETYDYELVTRNSMSSFSAKSNSSGELWLIVGTDSGFEGLTTIYYTKVTAVLSITN